MPKVHVYVISRVGHDVCKIGMTANTSSRLKALQTGSAELLRLHYSTDGMSRVKAEIVERSSHFLLSKYSLLGEWFSVSPEMAEAAVMSANDLIDGGHDECDLKELIAQTKFQIEQAGLVNEH